MIFYMIWLSISWLMELKLVWKCKIVRLSLVICIGFALTKVQATKWCFREPTSIHWLSFHLIYQSLTWCYNLLDWWYKKTVNFPILAWFVLSSHFAPHASEPHCLGEAPASGLNILLTVRVKQKVYFTATFLYFCILKSYHFNTKNVASCWRITVP